MEPRFESDLSHVRIHRDPRAAESARHLNALAYTMGDHIVFGQGQYAPETEAGTRLIAHELTHTIQQGSRSPPAEPSMARATAAPAHGALVQRDVKNDAAGNPVDFEFRVGNELDEPFVTLAKQLAGAGVLHGAELRALRAHALRRRGTVSDHARMFMAGMTLPVNAAVVRGTAIRPGASFTFPIASISPALPVIQALDREPLSEKVTRPLAETERDLAKIRFGDPLQGFGALAQHLVEAQQAAATEITTRAGAFRPQANALIVFARANGVLLHNVLQAMSAAASDSSAGDQVMAGTVYAVARASGSPMTADVLSGRIKVDALVPTAFARLLINRNIAAAYVTAAQASGLKGDTVYMRTDFDLGDVYARSVVVHELRHAQDDKAAGAVVTFTPKNRLEADAYRAQGRFLLEQIASQEAAKQAQVVAAVTRQLNTMVLLGMVIEAQSNLARFEPVVAAIAAAGNPPVGAAAVHQLLAKPAADLEARLLREIDRLYRLAPGETGVVEGLSGESRLDWIFRL
jgi:hypothetical protein